MLVHLFMWQMLCTRVPTCPHEIESDSVCVCVCVCVCVRVCVSECAEIMYCCSCPLIWQYNLSFALACCNLPIPQRGNYLGLRQREDTDQRKRDWESNRGGEQCQREVKRSKEEERDKKQSYWRFVFFASSDFYFIFVCSSS